MAWPTISPRLNAIENPYFTLGWLHYIIRGTQSIKHLGKYWFEIGSDIARSELERDLCSGIAKTICVLEV